MKNKNKILFRLMIGLLVLGLVGINFLAVVQAQDPRPPADTDDGGSSGGGAGGGSSAFPGDGSNGGGGGSGCAATTGQVMNWGFGPQGDIGVELKTGSWRTSTLSASDGNYGLGGLGVGIAKLHVALAPAQAKQLQPLIQDAGVYLNCNYPTIANIAVFSGAPVDPPATIEMSAASQSVTPDSNFEVILTIKNSLPNEITNVIVTNLMPAGFKALSVKSSIKPKDAQIIDGGKDGQLVVVNLDKLASKAKATIQLTVNADVDLLSGAKIKNTATLFYRESAADQAALDFTVGSDEAPVLAASAGGSGAEFVPPGEAPTTGGSLLETDTTEVEPASTARETKPGAETAAAGDAFVPPSNMPSTGGEIDLPTDSLESVGTMDLTNTELTVKPEAAVSEVSAQSPSLVKVDSEQPAIEVIHNTPINGPSLTGAMALLFLGLLVLGSGLTLWRRRFE